MSSSTHTSEAPQTGRTHPRDFYGWMGFCWIWPLLVVLAVFDWKMPQVVMRLFCKLSWVLFAGMAQGLILLCVYKVYLRTHDFWADMMVWFFILSFFVLPFGMCEWDVSKHTGAVEASVMWDYGTSFLLSFLAHMIPGIMLLHLAHPGNHPADQPSTRKVKPWDTGRMADWQEAERKARRSSGLGYTGWDSWVEDLWNGGGVSGDYYGHRGEFDLNDEARRVSEDMQQFHNNHRDADLSDHYYWEDVLDAETDDYLD